MGTSGFCDDTTKHSDGPDAVPAMQVMLRAFAPFFEWLGVHFKYAKIENLGDKPRHCTSGSYRQYHVQLHTVYCPSPGCSAQGSGSVYDLGRKLQGA
jgi:hypothetical protein